MPTPYASAEYWFSRAEEARVVAEQMRNPETRLFMLGIAQAYSHLAERLRKPPEEPKPSN